MHDHFDPANLIRSTVLAILGSPALPFERVLMDDDPGAGGGGGGGGAPAPAPAVPSGAPGATPAPAGKAPEGSAAAPAASGGDGGKAPEVVPAAPPAPAERKPSAAEALAKAMESDRKLQARHAAFKREQEEARKAIEAERAAIAKERETSAAEVAEAKELRRLIKDDPKEFLRRAGVTYEELTKAIAAGVKVPPEIRQMQEELTRLKTEREAEKAAAAEREKAEKARRETEAVERAQAQAFEEFRGVVKTNASKHALAAWMVETEGDAARGTVVSVATQMHQETGRVPSYEDVVERIDANVRGYFERMLAEPAFAAIAKAKLAPSALPAPSADQKRDPKHSAPAPAKTGKDGTEDGPPTLGNDDATAPGARGERALSDEERLERLIGFVEGARKKKTQAA
jgi:hypothetical protein